jgi:hypothetical protein
MTTKEQAAIEYLRNAGAVNEKKEDEHGKTRAGWWMDTVFLARNAVDAVRYLRGN